MHSAITISTADLEIQIKNKSRKETIQSSINIRAKIKSIFVFERKSFASFPFWQFAVLICWLCESHTVPAIYIFVDATNERNEIYVVLIGNREFCTHKLFALRLYGAGANVTKIAFNNLFFFFFEAHQFI